MQDTVLLLREEVNRMVRLEDLIWKDATPEEENPLKDEDNKIEAQANMSFSCIAMCCGGPICPPLLSFLGCR